MTNTKDSGAANDPQGLIRFVLAQLDLYEQALAEISSGKKETHWMWYIFPQIDGLAFSSTSKRYAIKSVEEAKAYLHHPVLGKRLLQCADAALRVQGRTAAEIFGSPDDMKLKSCATLFANISPRGSVFELLLDKYFHGERDSKTLRLLDQFYVVGKSEMMNLHVKGGLEIELLKVLSGEFVMGSENDLFSEAPAHRVTIVTDFWLGKYPVTQSQWQTVMGTNPSKFIESNTSPVDDYKLAPADGTPRLDNIERQPRRCLRGGAWDMNAFRCRSTYRSYDHKTLATNRFGLRIAVEAG